MESEVLIVFSERATDAIKQDFTLGSNAFAVVFCVRASHSRPKAETGAAVRDEVSGKFSGVREAAGWIFAHSAAGLPRECIRHEFQVSALAHSCPEWRYFSRRFRRGRNRG